MKTLPSTQELIVFVVIFLQLQCNIERNITTGVNDSANAIQNAISQLEVQSENWQRILQDLETKVQESLRVDIRNILDRGIASLGEQANCLIDIRTQQIKRELQNVLAHIYGNPEQPIIPVICLVSPPTIQMSSLLNHNNSRTIEFSGYDLDKGQYKIFLQKKVFDVRHPQTVRVSNSSIPISHLSIQTHYHAVFNFTDVNLDVNCTKFLIYNGTQLLSEINIEQKHCEHMDKTKTEQTVSVTGFHKDEGDKDFGWNNAEFKVSISLYISSNKQSVLADIDVKVKEAGGDTKGSKKETGKVLYTNTRSGYEIISINSPNPPSFDEPGYVNTKEEGDLKSYSGAGLVKNVAYYGRALGFDDLDKAKITIQCNTLSVTLRETGTCIP